jgi:hypothetical protein
MAEVAVFLLQERPDLPIGARTANRHMNCILPAVFLE